MNIIFGIPWMELKNSKVLPKTLTVIGLPKNNEMEFKNNIVNWQVRAVGTYTQIKMWVYQQTRLVRLVA